jgi:alcohol dehydrogenase
MPKPTSISFQHLATELRLFCGEDSLHALAREIRRERCSRAVVVCGRSVSRSTAMDLLRNTLDTVLVAECTAVQSNSPVPAVEEAARVLEELEADAVVAVGGGSAAVTARAASILVAEKRSVRELCTRRLPSGQFESPKLSAAKLPQFVVPTTPSTAFVKAGSAVHDPDTGDRLALFDPKTRSRALFVHSEFLRTSPSELVQSASLNTLSTAIEALTSPKCDPISEAMLMHSLRLTARNLARLSPEEAIARECLVLAAVLCGRGTEQAGGGLASVLAHAIGHRSTVANGIVNAIVLPHTMRFNAPATRDKAAKIVDGLGECSGAGESQPADIARAVDALQSLLKRLPIPRRLRDVGVDKSDLGAIADSAMSDWFIIRNPRSIASASEVQAILEAAW